MHSAPAASRRPVPKIAHITAAERLPKGTPENVKAP
jgi:hypothetical protein